ncbi:ATP-binding cassette domain-containing protein [Streptomyces sp. INA 01156]
MSDVLELQDVSVVREGRALVDQVSWSVKEGERWVILGPNGAGKTTLLNIASSYLFPSKGTATILGETLGAPGIDVFELRPRIGIAGNGMADKLPRPDGPADRADRRLRDDRLLAGGVRGHRRTARPRLPRPPRHVRIRRPQVRHLSEGERKRTLIARALMTDPNCCSSTSPPPASTWAAARTSYAVSAASPATRSPPP